MKAVGMVVEYNPFHNGHLFHLNCSKENTDAEVTIACMSGNFLQRGEMAIVDKFSRTRMALQAGVDLVVELPVMQAAQNADVFAHNSVQILHAVGCDTLSFGSELGLIDPFIDAVELLESNKYQFDEMVKNEMSIGSSYASATGKAFSLLSLEPMSLDLSLPNNTLGFHYVSEIIKNYPRMKPVTFSRIGAGYHETNLHESGIASATSIRKALFESSEPISHYMPDFVSNEMQRYFKLTKNFHHWENYWKLLQYKICSSTPEQLRRIYEVKEGIEHRFIEYASQSNNFNDFIGKVKSKRYTWTRLQRICLYILLNLESDFVEKLQHPSYIKILGFSEKGRKYLNQKKKTFLLPILSKKLYEDPSFQMSLRANQIYYNFMKINIREQLMHQEFEQPLQLEKLF
jgi:predicted nucleotidyltransferase